MTPESSGTEGASQTQKSCLFLIGATSRRNGGGTRFRRRPRAARQNWSHRSHEKKEPEEKRKNYLGVAPKAMIAERLTGVSDESFMSSPWPRSGIRRKCQSPVMCEHGNKEPRSKKRRSAAYDPPCGPTGPAPDENLEEKKNNNGGEKRRTQVVLLYYEALSVTWITSAR